MSQKTETNSIQESDAKSWDDPARGVEVYAPENGPFEAPAEVEKNGHLYAAIEERLPELGAEDLQQNRTEKSDSSDLAANRRNFLKLFGAATVAGSAACIRRPVEKAIPYVNQPVDMVPGVPTWYATTCGGCATGCGILVKSREGRPVKLEGLPEHRVSQGGLCAIGQSELQTLYHPERLAKPAVRLGGSLAEGEWRDVIARIAKGVTDPKKVAILTHGSNGHQGAFYKEFLQTIGGDASQIYSLETNGLVESLAAAHEMAYGTASLPRYELGNARTIVGIGSDFMDVGTSKVSHIRGFTKSHSFSPERDGEKMGYFVQFEGNLTLTGGKADERHVIPVGSEVIAGLALASALYSNTGSRGSSSARSTIKSILDANSSLINSGYDRLGVSRDAFAAIADRMLAEPSVVLCGDSTTDENSTSLQLVGIMLNELIGAMGTTVHLEKGWVPSHGESGDLNRFLGNSANIETLFVIGVDPVFTVPASYKMKEALQGIKNVVSMQVMASETDEVSHYVLPMRHFLESWGDEQPYAGYWSLRQPAIRAVNDAWQSEDMLAWVAGAMNKPMGHENYRSWLMAQYKSMHNASGVGGSFDSFWQGAVRNGFVDMMSSRSIGTMKNFAAQFGFKDPGSGTLKLVAPLDSRLMDGAHAHVPLLQEIGDPLTTITWDSWVAISPETAKRYKVKRNDVVKLSTPAGSFEVAVFPMPGLHGDTVSVARGNGHTIGTIQGGVGVNPLVAFGKSGDSITGAMVTRGVAVELTPTGKRYRLAAMQKQNDIGNRTDIVKTHSLDYATHRLEKNLNLDDVPDLYPELPQAEYRWGLNIDLASCVGCNACMAACAIENNVPQVGRDQILLGREMHWIRLDRYFSGPVTNPEVSFQPVMCQQCNHAPCEAVCPVFATNHDPEGVNAMTYNRCVGTRYCANACPYKVRRFNWWTHKWGVMGKRPQDRIPHAMNPDVTVRTRGIMEKCNFCYQRVRDAKHNAKVAGRKVRDGEIVMACQQTCPVDAISFGNLHDPDSVASRDRRDARAYLALNGDVEHKHYGIKTLPNVSYKARVTRKKSESDNTHG